MRAITVWFAFRNICYNSRNCRGCRKGSSRIFPGVRLCRALYRRLVLSPLNISNSLGAFPVWPIGFGFNSRFFASCISRYAGCIKAQFLCAVPLPFLRIHSFRLCSQYNNGINSDRQGRSLFSLISLSEVISIHTLRHGGINRYSMHSVTSAIIPANAGDAAKVRPAYSPASGYAGRWVTYLLKRTFSKWG